MRTSTSRSAASAAGTPGVDPGAEIRSQAQEFGFDAVGIAAPESVLENGDKFQQFLERGWHGEMDWLAAKAERRSDPRALWSEVRSIIMLGQNYGPEADPLAILEQSDIGAVSVYAWGRDYHAVVKKRLRTLGRWVAERFDTEVKIFVDTAPVLEKPLATVAGLGWQGKHTNLVSRDFGSWLFLGAIYTTLEIAVDQAESDHCGSCRSCLDVCPTDAFPAPYQLDARRCISYLTIEHKGQIPMEFRVPMGNRIFGCDDCLAVCPWNKYASVARESHLWPRAELRAPLLADLAHLDDAGFRQLFSKSPVKRLGRDRFVRNVLVAIGNSGDGALAAVAEVLLRDESQLVRGMAVWALARLLASEQFLALKERHFDPADADVAAEWRAV